MPPQQLVLPVPKTGWWSARYRDRMRPKHGPNIDSDRARVDYDGRPLGSYFGDRRANWTQ